MSAVKAQGQDKEYFGNDSEMQDIEEELRDVVFDYENSMALVKVADDFLQYPDKPINMSYDA